MTVPSEAIINLYDKEKSVDETNIRIRPRKNGKKWVWLILLFVLTYCDFALIVILFWFSRQIAQYLGNAQHNLFG